MTLDCNSTPETSPRPDMCLEASVRARQVSILTTTVLLESVANVCGQQNMQAGDTLRRDRQLVWNLCSGEPTAHSKEACTTVPAVLKYGRRPLGARLGVKADGRGLESTCGLLRRIASESLLAMRDLGLYVLFATLAVVNVGKQTVGLCAPGPTTLGSCKHNAGPQRGIKTFHRPNDGQPMAANEVGRLRF